MSKDEVKIKKLNLISNNNSYFNAADSDQLEVVH